MRKFIITLFAAILMTSAAGLSYAVEEGWDPGSAYNSRFNPRTVETLSGKIVKMDLFKPKGMGPGVQIILKTDAETLPVHLGPLLFMMKLKREIAPGDEIEITGSRVDLEGKPVIMASEVKKGDKVLKLRDGNGVPVWGSGNK